MSKYRLPAEHTPGGRGMRDIKVEQAVINDDDPYLRTEEFKEGVRHMDRQNILAEISEERERQISLGYTAKHDEEHGVNHLTGWLMTYAARADNAAYNRKWGPGKEQYDAKLRPTLIAAAALALAAIELLDGEAP
jgi:hypothetical protein